MKFAHFSHVWGKTDMTPHQRYEQLWRELEVADVSGYDYSFCVEHHFRPEESWMSSPSLYAVTAGAHTKNLRVGTMGYVVPLYDSLRLAEEIAVVDQIVGGRLELGLVPGINRAYFEPFGLEYDDRKTPTLEFVDYMRAAFGKQPFSFDGAHHRSKDVRLSVLPAQQPHPPLWMMSRDPETLEFCARNGISTGYFISFPHDEARPRYQAYLNSWSKAGWANKPNIGYSTVVYVDETDQKAMDKALHGASQAYIGFLEPPSPGVGFDERHRRFVDRFIARGETGAAEIMANLFDPDYLIANDLVFIGSPDTVARKISEASSKGLFNTFMGEFNFHDLSEDDLMRSIRLFGEAVIPALSDFEPY